LDGTVGAGVFPAALAEDVAVPAKTATGNLAWPRLGTARNHRDHFAGGLLGAVRDDDLELEWRVVNVA
jgi:hypothetical protein